VRKENCDRDQKVNREPSLRARTKLDARDQAKRGRTSLHRMVEDQGLIT